MCEGFSNKKEGNGNTARTSPPRRFPDSSTPGTRVTTAGSAEDEDSAAASVSLSASESL